MQFTNLNKLVRLFLLGSCALFLLYLSVPSLKDNLKDQLGLASDGLSIPIGLVFLGLITALGCLVEGIAEATSSKILRKIGDKEELSRWFGRRESAEDVAHWRTLFERAVKTKVGMTLVDPRALVKDCRVLPSAIVHRYAPPDHVKYIDAHDWTFMLSSALSVLGFAAIAPSWQSLYARGHSIWGSFAFALAGSLVVGGFLWTLALHNYHYTSRAVFRSACLWLWKKGAVPPPEPIHVHTDHGPLAAGATPSTAAPAPS